MANFTRRDVKTVEDSLRLFGRENNIQIGIDDSDNRPNVYRYICYHNESHMTCMIHIDFEQVEDLDDSITKSLDFLREYFTL